MRENAGRMIEEPETCLATLVDRSRPGCRAVPLCRRATSHRRDQHRPRVPRSGQCGAPTARAGKLCAGGHRYRGSAARVWAVPRRHPDGSLSTVPNTWTQHSPRGQGVVLLQARFSCLDAAASAIDARWPVTAVSGFVAHTRAAPALLARLTGAALVPCVPLRDGSGYRLQFGAPLATCARTVDTTQRINDLFEAQVRAAPEQYL